MVPDFFMWLKRDLFDFFTARAQQTGESSSTHPPVMSLPRLLCTVLLLALYSALSIVCLYVYQWWSRGENT